MDFHQTSKYLPLLLFVSLGALAVPYVVVAVKVGRRRESRRQAALARVAAELGMGFTPEGRWLVMYRSHKRLKPEDYRAFVEGASEGMLLMTGACVKERATSSASTSELPNGVG